MAQTGSYKRGGLDPALSAPIEKEMCLRRSLGQELRKLVVDKRSTCSHKVLNCVKQLSHVVQGSMDQKSV